MKKKRIKFIQAAHKAACNDWKDKIEIEFPKLFDTTYKYGDCFKEVGPTCVDHYYLLCQVDNGIINLICLESGNRYSGSLKVIDGLKITKEEFNQIKGDLDLEKVLKTPAYSGIINTPFNPIPISTFGGVE